VENPTSEGATTNKINLTELRADYPSHEVDEWQGDRTIEIEHRIVLALIDVVEAAQRVERADSNGGYISTVPSEATTALEELETALARFQP
jgi:hypothetical protein